MKTQYKTTIKNILNQVFEDQRNDKIPDGYRKIDYLRSLVDRFCESSGETEDDDEKLMMLMDLLESKGINCSI